MTAGQQPARPWRTLPDARPLRCWRTGELERARAAIERVFLEWANAWGLPSEWVAPLSCTDAPSPNACSRHWLRSGADAQEAIWIRWAEPARLASTFFGEGAGESPVVQAVARACEQDALARLVQSLGVSGQSEEAQPPDEIWNAWSGAAFLALASSHAHLVLTAGVLRRLPGVLAAAQAGERTARAAPVSMAQAISRMRVRLQVELEGCELGLGELQGLQPGDVLRLAHGVEAPAHVTHAAGAPLFQGWLARKQGRKAVELVPAAVRSTRDSTAKEQR